MNEVSKGKCPFGFGADGTGDGAAAYSHTAVAPAMSRDKLPRLVPDPIAPGADGAQTGRCLCGAVTFRLDRPAEKVFANHDETSRRWTGGVAMTMMIRAAATEFSGWGNIVQHATNDRDRHCFCRLCGTSLFVRHIAPEAMDGMISLSAGTLDSQDGLRLAAETYADQRPAHYAFAGERRQMTTAEVEAMYTPRPATAAE